MNPCFNPKVSIALATIRPTAKTLIIDYISKNKEKVLLKEELTALDTNKGLKYAFGQLKSLTSNAVIQLANEKLSGEPQYQRYPKEEEIVRDFLRQNTTLFTKLGVKEGELDQDDMLLYSRVVYELIREPGFQSAVRTNDMETIKHIVNAAVDREIKLGCNQKSEPGRPRRFVKPCDRNQTCRSFLTEGGRRRNRRKTRRTHRKRTARKHIA